MEQNPGIEAVRKLADMGYRFTVNGEAIKAKYDGPGKPDPDAVRPLLALVKENKQEAIVYLARKSQNPVRVLLCSNCPWHRENPWTLYPELPSRCSRHFDYLAADSQQSLGWRKREIPQPDLRKTAWSHDFSLANNEGGGSTEDNTPQQRVTCFQCHQFSPNDGPNPRQGWGRCLKRGRGRFGCAVGC
jgi:hypothetical protein